MIRKLFKISLRFCKDNLILKAKGFFNTLNSKKDIKMNKIIKFFSFLLFCLLSNLSPTLPPTPQLHNKWIVVTTINYPTQALRHLASLKEWKVVVVADKKTPLDWYLEGVIFLSIEEQEKLPYTLAKLLPWNHYCRKNLGYLYAIEHGAQIIYETDDDNFLLQDEIILLPEKSSCLSYDTDLLVVNPYAYFGQSSVWPRGYPLKEIGKPDCLFFSEKKDLFIPIQQGLVNKDPDVDAIFRLTRPEIIHFNSPAPIALTRGTLTPFNSQNTLFYHSAFWGLLIPKTPTFRVADIWRGYWVQRLLWDIDGSLCFLPPTAYQERNEHDLLNDFSQEIDLYLKVDSLISALTTWQSTDPYLLNRFTDLYAFLVAHNFIGRDDLEVANAWKEDLQTLGYKCPSINSLTNKNRF
jgi:hypothetical protein